MDYAEYFTNRPTDEITRDLLDDHSLLIMEQKNLAAIS